MIINKIKYKPFRTGLKTKFLSSANQITERTGFYVSIEDQYGNKGIGEISPLTGFSKESVLDAKKDVEYLIKLLIGKKIDPKQFLSSDSLYHKVIVPSVSFGFEQALLNLLFSHNRNFFSKQISLSQKEIIPVNTVIDLTDKNVILNEVMDNIKSGYQTIKLKVGRKNFNDDLEILDTLRKNIPDEVQIRLDANCAWDVDTAYKNIQSFAPYKIQYIEDPCEHIEDLINLSKVSPVPIAPDFTLTSIDELKKIITNDLFQFIVIKPMILGSIFNLIEIMNLAEIKNTYVVISSAFETAVGRSLLVFLSSLVKHNYAHGLATSSFFEDEGIPDPFPIENGAIKFNPINYPPKLEIDL
jgi:o-succinylbenzoate synthase